MRISFDKSLHIYFLLVGRLPSMHHADPVFWFRKITFYYFITFHQIFIIQFFAFFYQRKNDISLSVLYLFRF